MLLERTAVDLHRSPRPRPRCPCAHFAWPADILVVGDRASSQTAVHVSGMNGKSHLKEALCLMPIYSLLHVLMLGCAVHYTLSLTLRLDTPEDYQVESVGADFPPRAMSKAAGTEAKSKERMRMKFLTTSKQERLFCTWLRGGLFECLTSTQALEISSLLALRIHFARFSTS